MRPPHESIADHANVKLFHDVCLASCLVFV
jgi:hypothetical protein